MKPIVRGDYFVYQTTVFQFNLSRDHVKDQAAKLKPFSCPNSRKHRKMCQNILFQKGDYLRLARTVPLKYDSYE
jgi:hypothetical protein